MEQYIQTELVKELKNVSKQIKAEADPAKKIFLLSAAHGIADRSMRYNFSKDLLLTFAILNISYNTYIERLRALSSGDRMIPISQKQLDGTADLLDQLADAFKNNKSIYGILEDIMLLSFMSTGPGHYLVINGKLDGLI